MTGDAQAQGLEVAKSRLFFGLQLAMVCYFVVSVRLVDLIMLRPAPAPEPEAPRIETPRRADIVDRNGALLATSLRMASVYADTSLVDNPKALAKKIAAILPGENQKSLAEKLASGKRFVWLRRDVTPKQEYALNALGSPAINFADESRRIYPAGNLAAHVTGYADVDGHGIAGIENSLDKTLKASDTPVALTIDLRVQNILHRALEKSMRAFSAKDAVGMVMDVKTGEILAMVSLPDYDPHHPGEAKDDA
jgi:cell division protein FtsI (penicillin-binding protein 3)